jgi:membrane protein YdbS with pleckstrin-like domain
MAELEIRPTIRFIKLGYAGTAVLLAVAVTWRLSQEGAASLGAVVAAALLFLWPVSRHIRRQRIRCRLAGGQLRYEEGLVSTSAKTIPLSGIQHITIRRSALQRLFLIGNLQIETAGHSSLLELRDIDHPQKVTDAILATASEAGASRPRVQTV